MDKSSLGIISIDEAINGLEYLIEMKNDNVDKRILSYIRKCKLLGYDIDTNITEYRQNVFIIKEDKYNYTVLVPSNVTKLKTFQFDFIHNSNTSIEYYKIRLKVIGGKGLTSCSRLFANNQLENLDLSEFYTDNVIDMKDMFFSFKTNKLDLSKFNTSKVVNMSNMFRFARIDELVIGSWDTSNVEDMSGMFIGIKLKNNMILDLSKFNVDRVKTMLGMFCNVKLDYLNISSFGTSNGVCIGSLLSGATIKELVMCKFSRETIKHARDMFYNTNINNLYIEDTIIRDVQSYPYNCLLDAVCKDSLDIE